MCCTAAVVKERDTTIPSEQWDVYGRVGRVCHAATTPAHPAPMTPAVVQMNNGCVCCTVRGDLIRILNKLIKRKGKFDAILM